eukprot:6201264-Pleurochrysis_carterae.AAC.3
MASSLLSASAGAVRTASRRTASAAAANAPLMCASFVQRRSYTGGLTDKDRIFTNLYCDGSQFLDGAKKRVRGSQESLYRMT